jgi:tetratricopeptide (TPR) repeat protein
VPLDRDATLKKADKLLKQGKLAGAIEEYVRLVEDRPNDWNAANALGDLYVKAGDADRAAEQFTRVADHLYSEGFFPRASAVYKKVLKVKSEHDHAVWQLADIAGHHGLLLDARSYYARLIRDRRARGDERGAVDCLVRLALLEDAGVEARMVAVQALIPLGESTQAAKLLVGAADDLVKHGRMSEALDALTQAAQLDPEDAEIRDRLQAARSGDAEPEAAASVEIAQVGSGDAWTIEPVVTSSEEIELDPATALGALDSGVESAISGNETTETAIPDEAPIVLEAVGDDLGAVLAEIQGMPDAAPEQPRDLELIFEELRARVAQEQEARAREQFERGVRHLEEGRVAEAVANLEEAARTPTVRFEASVCLARTFVSRGELRAGVDWMERASEVPPPTPEEGTALLYELADALGRLGETGRALAVFMELEANSAGYRDVRERIARLSQTETGSGS